MNAFLQQFIANAIGHKPSSIIGGIAAAVLAGVDTLVQYGVLDIPALKPEWAHYVTLTIAALTFLKGLSMNPNGSSN